MLCNLRDSQTSKIIIHSKKLVLGAEILAIFSQDSELKLVMILASLTVKFLFARLRSLATKFVYDSRVLLQNLSARLASLTTKFVCKTRESHYKMCLRDSRVSLQNLSARLARLVRSDSRNEICVCESREASLATNFDLQVS